MTTTRQSQHTNGNETDFQILDSLVFPTGTPISGISATSTLTLTGVVSDGEIVTIGTNVYEFKASGIPVVGHIKVDVSGGVTAVLAKVALKNVINANEVNVIATNGGTGDTVILTAVTGATIANAIATTKVMTNATWGTGTLTGGIDGTVSSSTGLQFEDAENYYLSNSVGTIYNVKWFKIVKTAI